ncbi:rhomboid family intramembrane serine protease [Rhodovulum sp. DZ06]|uniref:rhomboid family intramembrane serine protease n=1 Tax=Rhodovulum sp. DZ06 TaxID=3425126 RepID=UPI003D332D5E
MFQFPPLPPLRSHHRRIVFGLTAIFAVIEVLFQLSDVGVLPQGWRWEAYQQFSFYDPWFDDLVAGRPAPPQVAWNMLTYAFLHGSLEHMLMNCAAFMALGLVTMRIFGAPLFALFFGATAVGGALCFGLIAQSDAPMVGVSGVVFGLIGVLKYAELAFIRHRGGSVGAFAVSMGGLVAINAVISVLLADFMAWETHLGGFLAGWFAAWWVIPKPER